MITHKPIGEYLLDARLITSEQLRKALDLQLLQLAGNNAPLGNVLLQLGIVEEQDIAQALKQQQGEQVP